MDCRLNVLLQPKTCNFALVAGKKVFRLYCLILLEAYFLLKTELSSESYS